MSNKHFDDTTEKIVLTQEGKNALEQQLKKLREVDRPDIIRQLQDARTQGDLSENADYDAAKDAQAKIENEIKRIEQLLLDAEVVKVAADASVVSIGKLVEFVREDTKAKRTVLIVGQTEADPDASPAKIASDSPLGRSLLKHHVGDEVAVKSHQPYTLKIKSIK